MGLFDDIVVEYPLPDSAGSETCEWQTKSLDGAMENYLITAEGRLMKSRYHTEDRSDRTLPGLLGLGGSLTMIHEGWDETGFSGNLNFHQSACAEWFELNAVFVDGQLVSIKRIYGTENNV